MDFSQIPTSVFGFGIGIIFYLYITLIRFLSRKKANIKELLWILVFGMAGIILDDLGGKRGDSYWQHVLFFLGVATILAVGLSIDEGKKANPIQVIVIVAGAITTCVGFFFATFGG